MEQDDIQRLKRQKKNPAPHKFVEKYERLVGKETGKESARILEANDQFGLGKYLLNYFQSTVDCIHIINIIKLYLGKGGLLIE